MEVNAAGSGNAVAAQSAETRAARVERQEPRKEERVERAEEPQQAKPVLNAQGQLTGTRINIAV